MTVEGFRDKLGREISVGDTLAYAVDNYGSVYLKLADVLSLHSEERVGYRGQKYTERWIRVQSRERGYRTVLRKFATRSVIVRL